MDYFETEIRRQWAIKLEEIKVRCMEILREEIFYRVYQAYPPKEYDRTFQLIDKIIIDVNTTGLFIHWDTNNMSYYSARNRKYYPDDYVTERVPGWINRGHFNTDRISPIPMFDIYPARNFMKSAKERIETELGLAVEIIDNIGR